MGLIERSAKSNADGKDSFPPERVAVHEAGHAVMALHVNDNWEHVSIVPNKDSAGHIRHAPLGKEGADTLEFGDNFAARLIGERCIMLAWGGLMAEELAGYEDPYGGAQEDMDSIADMLMKTTGSIEETNLLSAHIEEVVRATLKRRWREVTVLRDALLERKTIQRAEALDLLHEAGIYGPGLAGPPLTHEEMKGIVRDKLREGTWENLED